MRYLIVAHNSELSVFSISVELINVSSCVLVVPDVIFTTEKKALYLYPFMLLLFNVLPCYVAK